MQSFRALRREAGRFDVSQMRSWESDRPWNLTREDAEAQLVPGWWGKSARGTESASWEKGYIRPSPEFFTYPEDTRRAIAYHEAGHAMIEAAGGLSSIEDPLGMISLPGGQTLGYNAEEILAEGYSVLWCEPSWFDRSGAQEIRSIVIAMAKRAGFPLPSSAKTAMPSWRGLVDGPIWSEYPAVLLVDKTGGGRQSYEVYIAGEWVARTQRLEEGKAYIERKIGPCEFRRVRTVDWFGDPAIAYAAVPV